VSGARLRRGAWLAVPFVLTLVVSWAVAPGVGDAIARRLGRAAAVLRWPSRGARPAPPRTRRFDLAPCAVDASAPIVAHVTAAQVLSPIVADNGRSIQATLALGPTGAPAGARLSGVSSLGAGLLDGDVVVCVEGLRTPDPDSAIDVALAAVARGAPVLHGLALRGADVVSVTADWPPEPAAKAALPLHTSGKPR
jgi:hypothetical protein